MSAARVVARLVVAAVLAATLGAAVVPAAAGLAPVPPPRIVVAGFATSSYGLFDPEMAALRAALDDPQRFGPGGTVPVDVELRQLGWNPTREQLADVDVVVPGVSGVGVLPIATAKDFVHRGGALLLTEDRTEGAISPAFGFSTAAGAIPHGDLSQPRAGSAAANPTVPTHPVFAGPFGAAPAPLQFFNLGWQTAKPAHATTLATSTFQDSTTPSPHAERTVPTISAIEAGAVPDHATSGRVLVTGDVDQLAFHPARPDSGGFATDPAFALNAIAWLAGEEARPARACTSGASTTFTALSQALDVVDVGQAQVVEVSTIGVPRGSSVAVELRRGPGAPVEVATATLVSGDPEGRSGTWQATLPGLPLGADPSWGATVVRPDASVAARSCEARGYAVQDLLVIAGSATEPRGYGLLGSDLTAALRSALLDPQRFGPAGTVPKAVQLRRITSFSADSLRGVDILIPGLRSASTADGLAVRAFVERGGALLATEDAEVHGWLSAALGLAHSTGSPAVAGFDAVVARSGSTPAKPVPGAASHPVFSGPFGPVADPLLFYNVGWFTGLGPATALATSSYPFRDGTGSVVDGTTVAAIPPGGLTPGSGPVLVTGDVDVLTTYADRADAAGFRTHPAFALNAIAWLGGFVAEPLAVDAGPAPTGAVEGAPFSLAGSTTGGRAPVTTSWAATAGCAVADPAALVTTATCADDGTPTFTLTATDARGATSDTVEVAVGDVAPSAPGAPEVTDGSSPSRTGELTLAWAPSTDPGDDVVSYAVEARDADDAGWVQLASGLASPSWAVPSLADGTWSFRAVASDGAATTAGSTLGGIVVDAAAPPAPILTPAAAPAHDPTPGVPGDEWWAGPVTLTATADPAGDPALADGSPGSGGVVVSPATQQVVATGVATATARDGAGNEATAARRIGIDAAPPTVTVSCPSTVAIGSSAAGSWTATDAGSGVAGATSGTFPLPSGTAGPATASGPLVADGVGNAAQVACTYSVAWPFTGFFSPVDPLPTTNAVKAGQAVPLKFSLGGDRGLGVLATGSPSSRTVSCSTGAPVDDVEETLTAGSSWLRYDPTTDRYTYVWKTEQAWAGTCRLLTLTLVDGSAHEARFTFKR